jgi:glutathione S-transferase
MKLYYSPGACSLAPHIALREAALEFELVKVNTRERSTSDGSDWLAVNPNGYVPALVLDDGEVLTEVAAILQYIADRAPQAGLVPAAGTMDRYRLLEWLNFIATELHKGFAPMFRPGTPDEYKATSRERLELRLGHVAKRMQGREFAVGSRFTVADCYLYVVLGWSRAGGIDRAKWPVLQAYHAKIGERPAVQAARAAEGLPGA